MITFVLGTRPELIKTAPVIHELRRRGAAFSLVHTGQHYTPSLDEIFFRDLELPLPDVNLKVGSLPAAHQVAKILTGVAAALPSFKPRIVVVQGDTNSVLGGALAAHKLGLPVAHLEAGLRSDDWEMPEEGNRVLAGRVAALHFCPTALQAQRLAAEGITRGVHVVGNTVVDASLAFAQRAAQLSLVKETLELAERPYALLTLHRPSNVDSAERLQALLSAVGEVARARGLTVVFPIHPRTAELIRRFEFGPLLGPPFLPCEPVGYLDMLQLLQGAKIALTDSGGIQEEACTLKIPCVTLRPNTERPETVTVGANRLCDAADAHALGSAVDAMLGVDRSWPNPFGDGHTAVRVVDVLLDPATRLVPSGAP